eukprot:746612-Hanusia_phi.AAC.1
MESDSATSVHLSAQTLHKVCMTAAKAILQATHLLVTAGAGMSADSGLPTYDRIADNIAYKNRGLNYADLCRPQLLRSDPCLVKLLRMIDIPLIEFVLSGTSFTARRSTCLAGSGVLGELLQHVQINAAA